VQRSHPYNTASLVFAAAPSHHYPDLPSSCASGVMSAPPSVHTNLLPGARSRAYTPPPHGRRMQRLSPHVTMHWQAACPRPSRRRFKTHARASQQPSQTRSATAPEAALESMMALQCSGLRKPLMVMTGGSKWCTRRPGMLRFTGM